MILFFIITILIIRDAFQIFIILIIIHQFNHD
jgi:hypothetical protein